MKKVGVMIIGSKGSVATTLIAAQCAMRKNVPLKFQLPSEMDRDFDKLGLIDLTDIVFGGWDIVSDSYSRSCEHHNVVPKHIMPDIAGELDKTDVSPAVMVGHDKTIEGLLATEDAQPRMKNIDFATTVFTKRPLVELIKSLEYDILGFKKKHKLSKIIVINLASTEKSVRLTDLHESLKKFQEGIKSNDPGITTGMLYAYTAIKNGAHVINFTPSIIADVPALIEFAKKNKVALAGKDGKTGQTLYKTAIAPMLKHRALKLTGWYSTNILGNRDGQVLNDPEHRATKIDSKKQVLKNIMGYDDFDHQVHIHYYPPRGDSKEAWDNIDFTGWFNVSMQMKIDWLGDDSILAAPLVADLIRWVDFFTNKGECGVLAQLASYFKHPMGTQECDFFNQVNILKSHVTKRCVKKAKIQTKGRKEKTKR